MEPLRIQSTSGIHLPMQSDYPYHPLKHMEPTFSHYKVPVCGHLTKYYNLDYWIRHSFGSELFQPSGQPFRITSSCLWSFDKIFTIWTIGFSSHLVQT